MKLQRFSASNIKTWHSCQFQWWLTYILKLQEMRKPGRAAAVGTTVHKVLERYAKGEKDWETSLTEALDEYTPWKWAKATAHLEDVPEKMWDECVTLIHTAFDRDDKPFGRKIIGKPEQWFEEKLSDRLPIAGFMDLVLEVDKDTLEIRDWKTGRPETAENVEKDIQPRMYDLAGMFLWPKYKRRIVKFDYLKSNVVQVEYDDVDRMETIRLLEDTADEIESVRRPTRIMDDRDHPDKWKCNAWCIGYDRCDQLYQEHFAV